MSGFFEGDTELSEEEIDEIILETARRIKKYGMEMPAIMTLESLKPLAFVGGELTRLTLSPFFPVFGPNIDLWGQKLIYVFEDKKNVDKLIVLLEELPDEKVPEEPVEDNESNAQDEDEKTEKEKNGWRRWLPFD